MAYLYQELLNSRLMIVDNDTVNIEFLEDLLEHDGYTNILGIQDSREVEDMYMAFKPDLLLLDIDMPHLNGFQVMEQLKKIEKDSYLPVMVLTGLLDDDTRIKALSYGAQDFLVKPFNRLEAMTRIHNMLRIRSLHNQVREQNQILEGKVQERTRELNDTRLEIILRLGQAAEFKDTDTGDHILRMSHMCARLGELLGMDETDVKLLGDTSPMHDIGKIGIPDAILLKKGKLGQAEWKTMEKHTLIGAKLLDNHESMLLKIAREVALSHHEKWDGSGYPKRLRGDAISIYGRICCLADVFDALTSKRPYKDSYSIDFACGIIKKEREKQFDPELTDLFLNHIDDFVQIKKNTSKENFENLNFSLSERDRKDEGILAELSAEYRSSNG